MRSAPTRAKRHIGYLPEHPPVYADLTIDEYLGFCARLYGIRGRSLTRARNRVKEQCDLGGGSRLVGKLSRGEQQRVGIAQALIHEPPVVLLDEPTVGLDPIQLRSIRALVTELGKTRAVVLSTHVLSEVTSTCDRVLILESGRVLHAGRVADLNSRDARLRVRCSTAPDQDLLRAVPGVVAIDENSDGSLCIRFHQHTNPSAELVRLAVEQGWGLLEIAPERTALEQIFIDIVSGKPSTGGSDTA